MSFKGNPCAQAQDFCNTLMIMVHYIVVIRNLLCMFVLNQEEMFQQILMDEEKVAKWNAYLDMIDNIVLNGLTSAVECR